MNRRSKNCAFPNSNMTGYRGPMLIGMLGVSMIGFGLLLRMKGMRVNPSNVLLSSKRVSRHKDQDPSNVNI